MTALKLYCIDIPCRSGARDAHGRYQLRSSSVFFSKMLFLGKGSLTTVLFSHQALAKMMDVPAGDYTAPIIGGAILSVLIVAGSVYTLTRPTDLRRDDR
eukprot:g62543.t1